MLCLTGNPESKSGEGGAPILTPVLDYGADSSPLIAGIDRSLCNDPTSLHPKGGPQTTSREHEISGPLMGLEFASLMDSLRPFAVF